MTRDEFLDFLTRCVAANVLSENEARVLLSQFDAGEITDGALPLLPADAIGMQGENADGTVVLGALALIAVLLGLPRETDPAGISSVLLRGKDPANRDELQDRYTDWSRGLAFGALDDTAGNGAVRTWHEGMRDRLRALTVAESLLGAGAVALTATARDRVGKANQVNLAYLARFADEVAARRLIKNPLPAETVAGRAALYSGAGRAEWFRADEETRPGRMPGGQPDPSGRDGYVVDYRARDDGHTCSPCVGAEQGGPYLLDEGPMPGEVCFGRGLCRCTRRTRWAPAEAARLREGRTTVAG